MIKTIYINDMSELKDFVFEQAYNSNINRLRSSYFYRGISDVSYKLVTSLERNCKGKYKQLEKPLLDNFTKYVSIENPTVNESIWKAMIIGRHHGLPTRLLDWSHSTLVALHFANTENNLENLAKRDCAVWRIDMRDINRNLPEKYKEVLNQKKTFLFSVDSLLSIVDSIEQYDEDMQDKAFVCLEPPSIDQRIVNQYSFFTMIPNGITDLENYLSEHSENTVRYIISKELRWNLRDILDQFNINERMIYPGEDGIATWLARHYYVKD